MAYTPVGWANDQQPAINAVNLGKIDQGIVDLDNNKVDASEFATLENELTTQVNNLEADIKVGDYNYFTTTNSGNNYSITTGSGYPSYIAGMEFKLKINASSTGAITLNVDGLGAKNVLQPNGESVTEVFINGVCIVVYNGTNFILPSNSGSFFGDGSDGELTSGTTLSSTLNGSVIVKQYSSINLASGELTVSNPCQGLILYSKGNVVINGSINMSAKGSGSIGAIELMMKRTLKIVSHNGGAGGAGGNGGNYGTYGVGGSGVARINCGGKGGGGGGAAGWQSLHNGLSASAMEFGTGGAGQTDHSYVNMFGGKGLFGSGGGGAGQLMYTPGNPTQNPGGDGTYAGGFILIIAGGNVTINGTLTANGGAGGTGGAGIGNSSNSSLRDSSGGGGGGGSGGGVIAIYHNGTYTNNGTIQVNGGAGGTGGAKYSIYNGVAGANGSSGSAGTIYTEQL